MATLLSPGYFVAAFALVYILILRWAHRTLPGERWQIFASIPIKKNGGGEWHGMNITYYGLFVSGGYTVGVAAVIVMMGAAGVSPMDAFLLLAPMVALCVPAARWMAGIVEKKPQTLTVGGAVFVGLIVSPWLTLAVRQTLGGADISNLQVMQVMAAIAVGYAFGEGLGRMACISFGCCYGKPLSECPPIIQKMFARRSAVFTGATKKISYESGLEGQPVIPIQAITSAVCVGTGLLGFYLFLTGHPTTSFLITLAVTQLWRAFSEVYRADYRGGGKLSAYQYMALFAVVYGLAIAAVFPAPSGRSAPLLARGLGVLWSPWLVIGLELMWLAVLYYVGRSKVTGSLIKFHVVKGQI